MSNKDILKKYSSSKYKIKKLEKHQRWRSMQKARTKLIMGIQPIVPKPGPVIDKPV